MDKKNGEKVKLGSYNIEICSVVQKFSFFPLSLENEWRKKKMHNLGNLF